MALCVVLYTTRTQRVALRKVHDVDGQEWLPPTWPKPNDDYSVCSSHNIRLKAKCERSITPTD